MRNWFGGIFLLLSVCLNGQTLDGPFVGERFQVYNGQINYKIWALTDFIIGRAETFQLTAFERDSIQKNKVVNFPANYLFQEENHWIRRLYRNIPFDFQENQHLSKVKSDSINDFEAFYKTLIGMQGLYLFSSEEFKDPMELSKLDSSEKVFGFQIKEDYAYNRVSGKLEVYITGVAPINEAGEPLFWMHYKNLKKAVSQLNIKWAFMDALKNRTFRAQLKNSRNSILYGIIDHSYQNDLEAMVDIQLFEELIAQTNFLKKKGKGDVVFGDPFSGQKIKGSTALGILNGKYTWYHENGQPKMVVNYDQGKVDGKIERFYPSGLLMEEGFFEQGKRVDKWTYYFENGQVQSIKKYLGGDLEGTQNVYFSNGKRHLQYQMESGLISGSFEAYYEDGTLEMKGQLIDGMLDGRWDYNFRLDPLVVKILMRSPETFKNSFPNFGKLGVEALIDGVLEVTVFYEKEENVKCLNDLCLKMRVIVE